MSINIRKNKCEFLGKQKEKIKNCCFRKQYHICQRREEVKSERYDLQVIPAVDCQTCPLYLDSTSPEEGMNAQEHLTKLTRIVKQESKNPDYVTGGGDGILTVGGGKYWPGIYVMVKLIRQLGCNLPIEIWYRGESEQVYPEDLENVSGVTFHDVDKMGKELGDSRIPTGNPGSGGWEAKLYALYHTKLDRVMYLDADAYLVNDPEPLFKLLESTDFVYWQDLMGQARAVKWPHIWPQGDRGIMQVQGGQLLMDRNKAWKLIHAGFYMCQNSDYYFKFMYGDQDSWRVGLAAGCASGLNIGKADWQGVAFVCRYGGKEYVVHRCQGKLYAPPDIPRGKQRYTNPQYHLPREVVVFDILSEVLMKRGLDSFKAFNAIYSNKLWGGNSGEGSRLREGQLYIDTVNRLIESKGFSSVVDCGSGDGLIGSRIKCASYTGVDICPNVVRQCAQQYQKNKYFALDFYKDYAIIPVGDILLCKDVLHHWPNDWVINWLSYLIQSNKYKCILITQDEKQIHEKQDCHVGGYRALSHSMYPLNTLPFKRIHQIHHKGMLIWERGDNA